MTDEPTFGSRPDRPRRPVLVPPIGARVRITAGRYHGAVGILRAVQQVETPSGGRYLIAIVTRPRAGDTYAFPHDLEEVVTP